MLRHRHQQEPAISAGFLLFSLLLAALFPSCAPEARPSVVVIMIDTLRADHLGCYGFDRELSPRLTRLAGEGILFENAWAASPWTGPSVAAVVTGLYPDEVGIHGLFDPLPPEADTLAERLGREGYDTAAIISNAIVSEVYGHDQGYTFFHHQGYRKTKEAGEEDGDRKPRYPFFTADKVTDRALSWLAGAGEEPFFLYVHYTDPHEPYLAPPEWIDRVLGDRDAVDAELLLDARFTREELTAGQLASIRGYYEAEIAFADHEVGRLLDALPEDTLIVITGDHGEEFREHGFFLHGHTLFEELIHIPLIFAGPGISRGIRVSEPVSHVDICPTLLDVAGGERDERLAGRSLVPFFSGGFSDLDPPDPPRTLFSVLECRDKHILSARRGPWKLLLLPEKKQRYLLNLEKDPGEKRTLNPRKHKDIVSDLSRAISARVRRVVPTSAAADGALEEMRKEQLRSIGYIR